MSANAPEQPQPDNGDTGSLYEKHKTIHARTAHTRQTPSCTTQMKQGER